MGMMNNCHFRVLLHPYKDESGAIGVRFQHPAPVEVGERGNIGWREEDNLRQQVRVQALPLCAWARTISWLHKSHQALEQPQLSGLQLLATAVHMHSPQMVSLQKTGTSTGWQMSDACLLHTAGAALAQHQPCPAHNWISLLGTLEAAAHGGCLLAP